MLCVSLLMSCYLLLLRHCVWPLFYGCCAYLFLCLVISCCSGIVFDPCFTGVLCISSYVLLSLVAPALCLTPVFTGVVRISSYVLLSLVAPALCLTPVLRMLCVSLLMSCYLLLLQHCVWPVFDGCFAYLFLCLVISCCSGIVFDPCFTGVVCIFSSVVLSLFAPALCLTPFLRLFCVFHFCVLLSYVVSCCSGIVLDPCFTGVWCISSYVLLSLFAPALCLTPVLWVFCVSLLMSCYLLLLRHCVWPMFYGSCVCLFFCRAISFCSGIVLDPFFTVVLCISFLCLVIICCLLLLRHCAWPLFYGCLVYLFLCLVISYCSGIVFDPCFTGVLCVCVCSYVLLSLVAPALCLNPVLRVYCVHLLLMSCYLLLLRHCVWPLFYGCFVHLLLMSCYPLLLRHCVWPLFYGCFVYLFLCIVMSYCSGIVSYRCCTGVLCISSYVLISLVALALCLTPVLRLFCVSLLMSCYLLLLPHCVWTVFYGCFVCASVLMSCYLLLLQHCAWTLFYGCFVYLFLCLVISCCFSIVFEPCFTAVLCVSVLMSCYLLLLQHCVSTLFYGCFVCIFFLCLVISCCSGIVFDPCFTGVVRISSYVLLSYVISCCSGIVFDPCFTGVLCISSSVSLSLVAPALCLTPVLRVFGVSLTMSCYLLLLRHCVSLPVWRVFCVSSFMSCYLLLLRHCDWPLFYGCFAYLFLCIVISCCSGIVLDPCCTGVSCISSYVLLSLVAPALCLAPCFMGVLCVLCLVMSCCSGIVFDPCFTGVLCISSYVLLSLVAPALCLTPVLRVFGVSLLMSCYLLLLQYCVWPLFYGCFVYLFLCLVISCCSGIVFDPFFTVVLCISFFCLVIICCLLLLRHCVWPLFYGCFVYLFLCLVISCCSGIVCDPCFTGVLRISSYVLLSLVAPALCLTPVLRVFCVSLLMSCYLLLLRHCVWALFYGCFVYLFLCLVISCCSGIVFDPCFTVVLCISSYVLLSLVAPALCLTPLFDGCFVYLFLCLVISCCSGIVFDPCFTGGLCISSYVLLSFVISCCSGIVFFWLCPCCFSNVANTWWFSGLCASCVHVAFQYVLKTWYFPTIL